MRHNFAYYGGMGAVNLWYRFGADDDPHQPTDCVFYRDGNNTVLFCSPDKLSEDIPFTKIATTFTAAASSALGADISGIDLSPLWRVSVQDGLFCVNEDRLRYHRCSHQQHMGEISEEPWRVIQQLLQRGARVKVDSFHTPQISIPVDFQIDRSSFELSIRSEQSRKALKTREINKAKRKAKENAELEQQQARFDEIMGLPWLWKHEHLKVAVDCVELTDPYDTLINSRAAWLCCDHRQKDDGQGNLIWEPIAPWMPTWIKLTRRFQTRKQRRLFDEFLVASRLSPEYDEKKAEALIAKREKKQKSKQGKKTSKKTSKKSAKKAAKKLAAA